MSATSSPSPLAVSLNESIGASHPRLVRALSKRGRAAFFPSKGILGQAAQARGRAINATIGLALEDDGSPMRLACLADLVELPPEDAVLYAPSFGKPALRDRWAQMIREKNPSLGDTPVSRPVVTCALTHALSVCGQMFVDEGDELICPDRFWGNYKLVFQAAYGAKLAGYPTFVDGGFNVAGLRERVLAGAPGRRVVLLNFPNNPSGYTPTEAEARAIVAALVEAAEAGSDIVALIDDAYFGLVYEDGIIRESIFAALADAHENILAVKVDGATKEDYAWGFRVGFITYAVKGGTPELYSALESKTAGVVRGGISNAPHTSQSLLLKAYTSADYGPQKAEKYEILRRRYAKVRAVLAEHPQYAESFTPLPFNSGYFMCVQPKADAEVVRQILLDEFDTGLIATGGLLRVAFSSTPIDLIEPLFANLHAACARAAKP